jgi:hypothetical protein
MIFGFWARKNILEWAAQGRPGLQEKLGWTGPGDLKLPERADELKKMLQATFTFYEEYMGEQESIAAAPFWETAARREAFGKRTQAEIAQNSILKMIMPVMERYVEQTSRAQARLGALKILAAAYAHKAKEGTPPKNLDALKTAFPEGLPKDPFTGKDFSYQIKDGRPTISFAAPEPPGPTGTSSMNPAGPRVSPQGKSQGGDDF